jgi:hypothetical protein
MIVPESTLGKTEASSVGKVNQEEVLHEQMVFRVRLLSVSKTFTLSVRDHGVCSVPNWCTWEILQSSHL